jgi:hypothetical protein
MKFILQLVMKVKLWCLTNQEFLKENAPHYGYRHKNRKNNYLRHPLVMVRPGACTAVDVWFMLDCVKEVSCLN